jgi:hypothetical protein
LAVQVISSNLSAVRNGQYAIFFITTLLFHLKPIPAGAHHRIAAILDYARLFQRDLLNRITQ